MRRLLLVGLGWAALRCGAGAGPDGGSCSDGVRDGSETAVDCGGPACPACAARLACRRDLDCLDGRCVDGYCGGPFCDDGVKNGGETDVDCGGPVCEPCGAQRGCAASGDCVTSYCQAGRCQPSCPDGQLDGNETDVDCGGRGCPGCGDGQRCRLSADCAHGRCRAGVCAPRPALAFAAPVAFDTGLGTRDLRAADLDGDGRPDLAFATVSDGLPKIGVMLARMPQSGFLGPVYTADESPFAGHRLVALADFRHAGHPDALVEVQPGGGDRLVRMPWAGARFGPPLPAVDWYARAVVGDVDGDGWLDLVGRAGSDAMTSWGEPSGNFATSVATALPAPLVTSLLALGDLDRDGRLDCVLASASGGLAVARGRGGRQRFEVPRILAAGLGGPPLDDLALADLDGDGWLDLVVARAADDLVQLWLLGPGPAVVAGRALAAAGPRQILVADIDGDGALDLIAGGDHQISILTGHGDGRFDAPLTQTAGAAPVSIAAADWNGDGRLDLAAGESGSGHLWLLENRTAR